METESLLIKAAIQFYPVTLIYTILLINNRYLPDISSQLHGTDDRQHNTTVTQNTSQLQLKNNTATDFSFSLQFQNP